ncbi:MAG: hypothetical protein M3Z39_02070 [Lactobacillus apis]|nr:hypothetical protein [Lactobacillus apis]
MKKLQEKSTFVGRPFSDQLMDDQRTFSSCNVEMEQNQVFQAFLDEHELTDQRASMIVFGPENFMYWYGVLVPDEVEVPSGLMRFVLPQNEVALEELDQQNLAFFSQPLNSVLPTFLQKVGDEGIQMYENPGDSLTPYFVQTLNLATKKLAQMLYLDASE